MRDALRPRTTTISLIGIVVVSLGGSLFGLGCPPNQPPPGGLPGEPNRPIPDETEVVILSPITNQSVTSGEDITVSYQILNAPEVLKVSAFLRRTEPVSGVSSTWRLRLAMGYRRNTRRRRRRRCGRNTPTH